MKKVFLSLFILILLIFWTFQNSLERTWQQSYSSPYPLTALKESPIWSAGGSVNDALIDFRNIVTSNTSEKAQGLNDKVNNLIKVQDTKAQESNEQSSSLEGEETNPGEENANSNPNTSSEQATNEETSSNGELKEENSSLSPVKLISKEFGPLAEGSFCSSKIRPTDVLLKETDEYLCKCISKSSPIFASLDKGKPYKRTLPENEFALGNIDGIAGPLDYAEYSFNPSKTPIILKEGDEVLIVGDSMQQGVGRHVAAFLSNKYHIRSKNLAKQSTGLISPFNVDWNKTVREEMANHKYKAVVMMLGANDSYGITDPNTKKVYSWGTEKWQAHYLQRIMGIMYEAKAHGAAMIWVQAPNVLNNTLNRRLVLIGELIAKAGKQYNAIVISANQALGMKVGEFVPTTTYKGHLVKTRSSDGIHFTTTGEKIIANQVNKLFKYIPDEKENAKAASAPEKKDSEKKADKNSKTKSSKTSSKNNSHGKSRYHR